MPLSRRAQRSARVVALGAAALGLGPRTRPPATAPPADEGVDDAAPALRTATDLADAVGRLTAEGARPATPGRIAADPSPAAPRP